jgi:hypothetical protein
MEEYLVGTMIPDGPISRSARFPLCTSKQKELAINSEDLEKFMSLKQNKLTSSWRRSREKTRGGKNEGIFHYVVENTWWKNVRKRPFHYVYENKDSYKHLSIILMKIKGVTCFRRSDEESGFKIQNSIFKNPMLDREFQILDPEVRESSVRNSGQDGESRNLDSKATQIKIPEFGARY